MTVDDAGLQSPDAATRRASGRTHRTGYDEPTLTALAADAAAVVARYPEPRSALLPLLHLVQSVDGYVSPRGIAFCAQTLSLTTAEVSAVATFYSQYKRHPNGRYTVGVCTNTLCAVMGGDALWETLTDHLGIGHDETTPDGAVTLERVECNAACDYAPVVMVNWEFFDEQTPGSVTALVDTLRSGRPVRPTRGADDVVDFRAMSRVLAGFPDGRADEGPAAGEATLRGTRLARERGWVAPPFPDEDASDAAGQDRGGADGDAAAAAGPQIPTGAPRNDAERPVTTPTDASSAPQRRAETSERTSRTTTDGSDAGRDA
ncbi:NADH-quinone oxidoreductase subunit NuoE [Cellulomonas endophytica]|uniref:NADH-quinone oxidoreductase subunit NuoE n=1 Tax=Cellulomonas endophytica TaxID=2494735 RepID=UPI001010EDFC|nr:NADH-quinone oxidoreductase subunit NuoE [Cellulomonas endophytica]